MHLPQVRRSLQVPIVRKDNVTISEVGELFLEPLGHVSVIVHADFHCPLPGALVDLKKPLGEEGHGHDDEGG